MVTIQCALSGAEESTKTGIKLKNWALTPGREGMVNFDQVPLNEGNEESFKENAQMFGPAKAKMRASVTWRE